MKKYLFPLLLLLIFSCKDDETATTGGEYNVDSDFEYYVQLFVEKGNERGANIDFTDTGLLVEYSDMVNQGASGWCFVGQHHIVIDKSEWDLLTEDEKIFLFAHELGHCDLDRGHKNEQFTNGFWKSIMRGDPLNTIQSRTPVGFYGFRQDYFWDELFNPNQAAPSWGERTFDFNEISNNEKELLEEKTDQISLQAQPNIAHENYEFEIDFNEIPVNSFLTELSWGTSPLFYKVKIYNNWGILFTVETGGKEQSLFYTNNFSTFNNSPFEKITIRQHENFTKVFFNEEFVFHLDAFPNTMQQIKFSSSDNDDNLIQGFKIEKYVMNKIL